MRARSLSGNPGQASAREYLRRIPDSSAPEPCNPRDFLTSDFLSSPQDANGSWKFADHKGVCCPDSDLDASGVMPTAKAVDPFETPFTLGGACSFSGPISRVASKGKILM